MSNTLVIILFETREKTNLEELVLQTLFIKIYLNIQFHLLKWSVSIVKLF